MPTHRSKRAIAQVLRYAGIVEDGSLHDTSGEDNLIASWVVVRLMSVSDLKLQRCRACTQVETTDIDCICRHSPFIAISRFTKSRPFAFYGELRKREGVSEEGCAADVDSCVVFCKGSRVANIWALRGIANFLSYVVDWIANCKLTYWPFD